MRFGNMITGGYWSMADWLGLGKVHDIILYFGLLDTTRQGFWDKGIDLNPICRKSVHDSYEYLWDISGMSHRIICNVFLHEQELPGIVKSCWWIQ